jgi:hypothetical protein
MGSVVALPAEAATPYCEEGRDCWGMVSTHFMRHLLSDDGQEPTRHQFAQDRAKLLALTNCQPLPQVI